MLKSKITNIKITTDEDNTPCVLFNIDNEEWLEWTTEDRLGQLHVERTDSHLKSHYDGTYDVDDILDYLDTQIAED